MPTAPDSLRLPVEVTPDRYTLSIAPDLDDASFSGTVAIELTVHEATDHLICNAAELEIVEAAVELPDGTRHEATTTLDAEAEQARFDLDETLAPGAVTLHVRFVGILNDKLRGFYRSTFTDDDGETRTMAVTQFEATDARRAFPCWDEPAHKAVYAVTLEVADDLFAISNGPELSRESLDGGRVRITFAETMPMSTYLVAFVVGPLEATAPIDVAGVPLRVVHRPGQAHLAQFALDIGAFALEYFADYYGIVYPGEKMDMVAVPDFAFGAMENLGCVTYREALLLVDPATATQSELLNVVDVIAHELAHMWFGDLVTMSWWNGIWLNEAFATFMEMKCSAAYRPQWERWMHFGRERSTAFDTDALVATRPIEFPVHSPADAEGMFDVLTYQKGSAVVRMLEQYLGEDAFRDGIRRYLQTHQFGNTETGDLWDALEAETGEPVRAMMDSWIFQGGFPLVDVSTDSAGALRLTQQVFRYDGSTSDARWHIPVVVRHGDRVDRLVLDDDQASIETSTGTVMANAGGHGFYRVAYDAELQERLLGDLGALEPLERYAVLDDALALCLRGDVAGADLARIVAGMASIGETDLSIWQLGAESLDTLDRVVTAADRPAWNEWQRTTLAPLWEALGPDVQPDDDDRRRALRGVMLSMLGGAQDPGVVTACREAFARSMTDAASVDPGVASGALQVVARLADADEFRQILDRFRNGTTPQEQMRHLYAAARVEDTALFEDYLALIDSDEVRSQNLAFAARAALHNPVHVDRAWTHITGSWDNLLERLPFNSVHRMVEGVTAIHDRETAAAAVEFLDRHTVANAEKAIAQHLERMWVSVALADRERDRLVDSLR
ncbi:M1 family metallopeptidase [Actinospongicola halichondriae]|uniref:M1 family metallopeptidase n=1 Tax=Actinospongicola halichondriae TaxID=3236844 RepID=UPI003D3D3F36